MLMFTQSHIQEAACWAQLKSSPVCWRRAMLITCRRGQHRSRHGRHTRATCRT